MIDMLSLSEAARKAHEALSKEHTTWNDEQRRAVKSIFIVMAEFTLNDDFCQRAPLGAAARLVHGVLQDVPAHSEVFTSLKGMAATLSEVLGSNPDLSQSQLEDVLRHRIRPCPLIRELFRQYGG